MCALSHKEPDRVPMLELEVETRVREKLLPGASMLDFYEWSDLEAIVIFEDVPYVDVRPGVKRDHFGVLRDFRETEGLSWPFPVEPLVPDTENDLMGWLEEDYDPPDPGAPGRLATLRAAVDRFKGEKAVIFGHHSSFIFQSFIRGFENLLMDYHLSPEFAMGLTDVICDYWVDMVRNALDCGADAVIDCEDYCGDKGPFLSIEHFREFVLPGLERVMEPAKERGVPFLKHSDGYLWPLLDIMVDAGIDGLHAIEPAAGMDIGKVKEAYGARISLIGNVDCAGLLTFGTPEEVREATRACIAAAAPGGGYILASSNIIHVGVPPENYLAMVEACKEFGKYPVPISQAATGPPDAPEGIGGGQ
jgi:uroporphyrinogen decarboxylase